MSMKERVKENSVIQINENAKQTDWIGALLMVDKIKTWGVRAFIKIPNSGNAFTRLEWNEFDYIGEAAMLPAKEEI